MTRTEAQESARKCLSGNRDIYTLQSRMTVGGRVPTIDEVRREYEREQLLDGSPVEPEYEH